jgi:hypothetical protein
MYLYITFILLLSLLIDTQKVCGAKQVKDLLDDDDAGENFIVGKNAIQKRDEMQFYEQELFYGRCKDWLSKSQCKQLAEDEGSEYDSGYEDEDLPRGCQQFDDWEIVLYNNLPAGKEGGECTRTYVCLCRGRKDQPSTFEELLMQYSAYEKEMK